MAIITEVGHISLIVKGIQGLKMTLSDTELIGFAGDEASFVVSLESINEFARSVNIETTGFPMGSTVSYSAMFPITVAPGFPAGVIVKIMLSETNDIVGTYDITVTATSTW